MGLFSDIDLDAILDDAEQRTDDKLAGEISSLTRMTDAQIKELFPKTADATKLVELMQIVKTAEDRNTKVNNIVANSEKFAGTIVTLLDKLI
ncbi:MAG: hypothetical protein PF904_17015 [Kiritimatiellae bacterium]|nr:hypothetical protein [Kiritimatiellia bacterium]